MTARTERFRHAGWLLLLVIFAVPPVAQSARVVDLYTAEVSSPGGELAEVFRTALAAVLVRVTGSRAAASPATLATFGDPARLVQQYRPTDDGQWQVGFDPAALRAGLDRAGLPIWGEERPAVALWLAVDAGRGERDILAAAAAATPGELDPWREARDVLEDAARERGLPLILPLVDSEDLSVVSFPELWGDFSDGVLRASSRYRADAVLVGRARGADPRNARVRWTLWFAGERSDWTASLSDGLERAADLFAERLATPAGSARELSVLVREITDLDAYGRVLGYLQSLGPVEQCDVVRVAGDRAWFRLRLRGDPDQLLRVIALRPVLRPVELPGPAEAELVFRVAAGP